MDKGRLKLWTGNDEFFALQRWLEGLKHEHERTAMGAIRTRNMDKAADYAGRADGISDVIKHLEDLFNDARSD